MKRFSLHDPWRRRWRPTRRRFRHARARRGVSLMEVMLATTLVLGAVMALSRVAFLARKHTHSAEDRSMAQIHCQNILEEIMAGTRPLQNVSPQVFEGEQWIYMVELERLDQAGLARVAVTVDRLDPDETTMPTEDSLGGYRLVRWMRLGDRDTSIFDDMLEGDAMSDQDMFGTEPQDGFGGQSDFGSSLDGGGFDSGGFDSGIGFE